MRSPVTPGSCTPSRRAPVLLLACLVLGSPAAAEPDCDHLGRIHRVSYKGQEARLFDVTVETWEANHRRLPDPPTLLRRLGACIDRLGGDPATDDDAGQVSAAVAGLLRRVDWSVSADGTRLQVRVGENESRGYRTDARPQRLARRVIRELLADARLDGDVTDEAANLFWFLWFESFIEAFGQRYNHYEYSDEIVAARARDRGKSFAVGFNPVFLDDRVLLGEIRDSRLTDQGLRADCVLTALDGEPVGELSRPQLQRYWYRLEPFRYTLDGLDGDRPFRVEGEALPLRHATLQLALLGDAVYLRLQRFASDSLIEIRRALREARRADARRLVIDVRENPGGALSLGLVDIFFKPGQTLATYRDAGVAESVDVDATVEYVDLPLVVLVNRESASMAEVLAAAIKTHDRGILIGETTHGKGVGQRTHEVLDEGLLHLVQRTYYYPGSEESWNGEGVPVDVEAGPGEDEAKELRAILESPLIRLEEQLEKDPALRRAMALGEERP